MYTEFANGKPHGNPHKTRNGWKAIFKSISAYDTGIPQLHKFCSNVVFLNFKFLVKIKIVAIICENKIKYNSQKTKMNVPELN
jgi:hypothetical protein